MKEKEEKLNSHLLANRTSSSLLAAAAGDAMGWMTEFIRSPDDLKRKMGVERITDYQAWNKQVGGRFQGYKDEITAGEYSDDTQLTICTAACISQNGSFDYRTFCDFEYPLWLEYARGAGGTVKEAAEKIQRKSADWNSNFFSRKIKDKIIDYRDGGANGAAMRISPHVLANAGRWTQAEADIWRNSIISHGHPRAILGGVIYGYALHNALHWSNSTTGQELIETLGNWTKKIEIPQISSIRSWINEWNKGQVESFEKVFINTKEEAIEQLRLIWSYLHKNESPQKVLEKLGCFESSTKGSGLATGIAGIYLFARNPEQTEENIITATNMIGSDTDSIAAFVGGLGGAAFGLDAISEKWRLQIQDAELLLKIGKYLADVSNGEFNNLKIRYKSQKVNLSKSLTRQDIKPNMRIIHCLLGEGIVTKVDQQDLLTKGKTATLVNIRFDMGQSCKYAFRKDGKIDNFSSI
jgi:ADP-ribosylglycohydrolase